MTACLKELHDFPLKMLVKYSDLSPSPLKMGIPRFSTILEICSLLLAGGIGGYLAHQINLPMPYLVGSLVTTAVYAVTITHNQNRKIPFSKNARWGFMAVIGVMIGASFDQTLFGLLPQLWLSILGVLVYVPLIQFVGFQFFSRIGGYDLPTATFAAMPGGLIESVEMGVQAGGDVRILSVQHFSRIIMVVLIVPFAFFIWSGESVGSAAGQQMSELAWDQEDVVLIIGLAVVGVFVGKFLRLPVYHIIGPLLLSSLMHALGFIDISSPDWLLSVSQLVIGVGLGTAFSGINLKILAKTFGLGLIFVSFSLVIGLGFAWGLSNFLSLPTEDLFICFAIGGVTEMGLIALSLGINPVVVAVHHLFRISFTVLVGKQFFRRLSR